MSTPSLRGLAKAYSDKLIDRKQYIRERRELIDSIVSGTAEIVPYSRPKKPNPDLERTFSDGDTTIEIRTDEPQLEVHEKPTSSRIGQVVIGVAIIVGILFWFKPWESTTQREIATQNATTESTLSATPTEKLLVEFLDQNQWRDDRIAEFSLEWQQADTSERAALIDGPSMRRATDVLYQKILEENALFDLGEGARALAKQRRLLNLAAVLAIDNERFDRLEADWRENHLKELDAHRASEVATVQLTQSVPTAPPPSDLHNEQPASTEAVQVPLNTDRPDELADTPIEPTVSSITTENQPSTTEVDVAKDETVSAAERSVTDEEVPVPTDSVVAPKTELNPESPDPSSISSTSAVKPATETTVPAQSSTTEKTGCRAALAKRRRPYCRDTLTDIGNGPMLAVLPVGRARIGGTRPEEQPTYEVSIAAPFALSIFEISVEEFSAFCKATSSPCPAQPWNDPKLPVVNVTWADANAYAEWLANKTGARYRLPSESEWEYAARAGTATRYPFGDEVLPTHARFSFRGAQTTPLASDDRSVNRNQFRLYHMIGNVREWVLDAWTDNYVGAPSDGSARGTGGEARVARGGSFADGADGIRSAARARVMAMGDQHTGFRVLREVE